MAATPDAENLMEYILIHFRWVFVIPFLLPLSFLYDMWMYVRNYIVFQISSAPYNHDAKVKYVQKQVQEWNLGDKKQPMCTGRPGWQTMSFRRPLYKESHFNVSVNLVDILEVNRRKMTVRCEPLVNMGQLSATLLPLGFTLPVVPEIDDLTVGGMVMGTGIESSSHVHGLFQHICVSYEIVLADGSVVSCSKDQNVDLYYSIPWSYGTLGFLTSVEIRIIPSKKYIKLKYHHANNKEDIFKLFTSKSNDPKPAQFIEGLVFSETSAVIMTGEMVDNPDKEGRVNSIGNWYKPWFFTHVQSTKNGQIEFIPTREYFHRHTKSLFWELQDIIPFGNNIFFRWLFGWLMPPKVSLLKRTQSKAIKKLYEKCHIIQDMLIPIKDLGRALDKFHDEVEVYPIWLCPFKLPRLPGLLKLSDPSCDFQMYVDIGVYGVPKSKKYETVKSTREIEDFVSKCGGFQMLYADTYTTKEEFRKMFDHTLYDWLRKSLDCEKAFPEIYDKVNKNART